MKVLGSSPRRPTRSGLRPSVEALEGRLCLSTFSLHPLPLHPLAAHLGTRTVDYQHHPRHSVPNQHETDSGRPSPSISAMDSTTAQKAKTTTSSGGNGWVYTREGSLSNVATPDEPGLGGLALEGGGTDIDSVFTWMRGQMGGVSGLGGIGDFLVIRATDDTGYNDYLYSTPDIGGFHSVATLDIPNRAAANDPAVKAIIENAGALFIGGGNQADYVKYWEGTPVQTAIADDLTRGVPLGGTSAGTDVIGKFIYSAEQGTITSAQALDNPFDNRLTLDENFLGQNSSNQSSEPAFLSNTILDTHFVTRDRMGRMVAFLGGLTRMGGRRSPWELASTNRPRWRSLRKERRQDWRRWLPTPGLPIPTSISCRRRGLRWSARRMFP